MVPTESRPAPSVCVNVVSEGGSIPRAHEMRVSPRYLSYRCRADGTQRELGRRSTSLTGVVLSGSGLVEGRVKGPVDSGARIPPSSGHFSPKGFTGPSGGKLRSIRRPRAQGRAAGGLADSSSMAAARPHRECLLKRVALRGLGREHGGGDTQQKTATAPVRVVQVGVVKLLDELGGIAVEVTSVIFVDEAGWR